jgi:hypothetical protein
LRGVTTFALTTGASTTTGAAGTSGVASTTTSFLVERFHTKKTTAATTIRPIVILFRI